MRLIVGLMVCLVSMSAFAKGRDCKADKDCRIVAPSGCCTGCAGEPMAVSKSWHPPACGCALEEPKGGCPKVASPDGFKAVCQSGQCVRVAKKVKAQKPAQVEKPEKRAQVEKPETKVVDPVAYERAVCDRDEECFVDTFGGCCSRCPGPPHASSRRHPPGAECACRMPEPRVPGPGMKPPEPCKEYPPAGNYRAVCKDHHCQLENR